MFIEWSKEAIREAEARFGTGAKQWKLVFDTEGCGCAVNGVPTFWIVASPDPQDKQAETNFGEAWIKPQHELYFDDRLRVSFVPEHRSFKLASDGQIYTNRLKLENRAITAN